MNEEYIDWGALKWAYGNTMITFEEASNAMESLSESTKQLEPHPHIQEIKGDDYLSNLHKQRDEQYNKFIKEKMR